MSKKQHNQVNIYEDFSDLIPQKSKDEEPKRFTMILPQGVYDNIAKLANSEDTKIVTYIREKLILPKLQEIADELKEKSDQLKFEKQPENE